jgi:hypothetical protein
MEGSDGPIGPTPVRERVKLFFENSIQNLKIENI